MHALSDKFSFFILLFLIRKKKVELFSTASFLPLPVVDLVCSFDWSHWGMQGLSLSTCKNLSVLMTLHIKLQERLHWSSESVFQWVSPSGCLQNNPVSRDSAMSCFYVERSVYLRKGVPAFEREQEPAPQPNTTMTAAEIEESLQSPVYCTWRSWSCLARMHILFVAQLGAVLQDSKTASYSIACKEGLFVRNQDQELLRGFLISWKCSR